MSLQKALVHLNMRGGMDSKDDNRLVIPSKLITLRDAVFDDASTLVTRGGYSSHAISTLTPSGVAETEFKRLFTNQGNLVIEGATAPVAVVKDAGIRDARPAAGQRLYRGSALTRPVSGNILRFPNGTYTTPLTGGDYDVAFNATKTRSVWAWSNYTLVTPTSGRLTLSIAVVDEATQNVLYTAEYNTASTVYQAPRVVYTSGADKFLLYYAKYTSGGTQFDIIVRTITATGAVAVGNESVVWTSPAYGGAKYIGTANYIPLFDVVPDKNNTSRVFLAVAYENATPNDRLLLAQLGGSDGYTVYSSGTITPTARVYQLAITTSDAGDYYTLYGRGATGYIRCIRSTTSFTVNTEADASNRGSAGTEFGRITAEYDTESSAVWFAYDSFNGRTTSSYVRLASITRTMSAYTDRNAIMYWFVGGRLTKEPTTKSWYLPLHNNSATQPTFYLLDVGLSYQTTAAGGPSVVARMDYGECGYINNDWCQTQRVPSAFGYASTVVFGYPKWVPDAQLVNGQYVQPSQLNRVDFDLTDQLGQAEMNGLTYLAGGCPYIYDGTNLVEEGFHHAPEMLSLTATTAGNGNAAQGLASGTYYFCMTLAWQDARGNWHESAPSNVLSVALTNPGNPDALATYALPYTQKADYRIIWYRTIASASLGPFYRTITASGATVTSDATLAACEQLYTTPGVEGQPLYHDPAPSCRHIENHQDRLFLSGCGDGTRVFYSNKSQLGRAVEFSTLLFKRTDYEFGRVVNTQSQDGKLFVFGERKIGVLLGQGPTDTGEQDGYSDIEVIVHDTGAKWAAPKGIATTNEGVWFQSNSGGIRLLGRNGALVRDQMGKYKGSEVDRELGTNYNCNAVVGVPKQQIRFYHTGGEVLVYDTTFDQWSRFSNHTHVDAAYAEGRFYHVRSTNKLLYYNEGVYTDDGTAITVYLVTPPLQFAGIQGFQRLYRAMFLGGPVDASTNTQVVSLYAAYDFSQTLSTLINAQDITTSSASLTQFEHHFAVQKCEALQLVLEITSKTSASRFRLTDITLQVGVKQGRFKLPAARRL